VILEADDFCVVIRPYVWLHFRESILETIKEGRIVPSEITVELIRKAMEMSNAKRVLIDGFPRCEENRIAFGKIVSSSA
jgi:UMP-CMP kinase